MRRPSCRKKHGKVALDICVHNLHYVTKVIAGAADSLACWKAEAAAAADCVVCKLAWDIGLPLYDVQEELNVRSCVLSLLCRSSIPISCPWRNCFPPLVPVGLGRLCDALLTATVGSAKR